MFKKKLFLTSGIIMAITTLPAIADDVYNDDIAGQCVVGFLGGTGADNSTAPNSFQAQYDPNEYDIDAGYYLAQNEEEGTQCPANSFCTGGTYTFSETTNQGIESCPTGFTLSAEGAKSQSDCYRTCTTNDVAHSASVSGGFYYGNNNQCVPESCVTGYHVQKGKPFAGIKESEFEFNMADYDIEEIEYAASCNMTPGDNDDYNWYNDNSSNWKRSGNTFNQSDAGRYCWCRITGYTTKDGTFQDLSTSSFWVFYDDFGNNNNCGYGCEMSCNSFEWSAWHPTLLDSVGGLASCVANEINVNWYNGETLYETNQCTYDGAITLPTAPEKTGYTFKGWKLVTGSSN
ncbi:MAG: InlB B-repeat-containing protein [Alphaproteobacteria bacterium]